MQYEHQNTLIHAKNGAPQGVAEPLAAALNAHELYIVTTKQSTYTEILLRDMAQVPIPASRIFSQTVRCGSCQQVPN
jgi:hypothetical protein